MQKRITEFVSSKIDRSRDGESFEVGDVWKTDVLTVHVFFVVAPYCSVEHLVLLVFANGIPWPVATMTISQARKEGQPLNVDYIEVNTTWRRQGIASEVWRLAESHLKCTLSGDAESEAGEGFLESLERPKG